MLDVPEFSTNKGIFKLRDIQRIEILTERIENNTYLYLQANLRNGRTRQIGGLRLFDEEKPHPRRHLVAFKLPSERDWTRLKPDELTINVGVIKATWRKGKEETPS